MDLSGLKFLVVDEIDRMLEQGHFEELRHIVQDIHRYCLKSSQLFSKKKFMKFHLFRYMKEQQLMESADENPAKDGASIRFQLQTLIFSATLTFIHHIPLTRGEKASDNKLVDAKQKVEILFFLK